MSSFNDLEELKRLMGEESAEEPKEASKAELVLLIDDDLEVGSALRLALESSCRLRSYANPKMGVDAVGPETAAVILDVKMPEMDGFATYEAIRQKDIDVPIIFHSAYQDLKDPFEIINKFRPFGYIRKGSDLRELQAMVKNAIGHRTRLARHKEIIANMEKVRSQMEGLTKRTPKK